MAMTEQQIQLVIAAQGGDVKSFEQLFAIYYDKVYGFARMILKNEHDAEDVLQEAFITAWRKLNTLETPATFSVWIQIIAKNLCNMQLRRKNMAILLDAEQDIENIDIEDNDDLLPAVYAEREDLRERLGRIIDSLSDVQRQTIVLYYFNELSVDEISDIMECSPGTVKSRLFLARNAIKAEVGEQERKSGQKFYGVAGIPMLPLGNLVQAHMKSLSIGQGAANASLSAITDSIARNATSGAVTDSIAGNTTSGAITDSIAGNTTAGANAAMKTSIAGVKMAKLSLSAKILICITTVAVVGAAAVLTVMLITGAPKNNPPSGGDPTSGVSSTATGETTAPGDQKTTAPGGQETTPGGQEATAPGGQETTAGGQKATAPGGQKTTAPGGQETTTPGGQETPAPGGKETPAPGGKETPAPGGQETTASGDQGTTTPGDQELSASEMDALWQRNNGYRKSTIRPAPRDNAAAAEDQFVRFIKERGKFKFEYGIYRTSYWLGGEITKAVAAGGNIIELTLQIPAAPETEMDAARPARTETVYVHEIDHRINIKIEALGDGAWYSYEYGGNTLEEAFNSAMR